MENTKIELRRHLSATRILVLAGLAAVHTTAAAQQLTFDLREQTASAEVIVVGGVFSVREAAKTEITIGGQMLPVKVFDAEIHVDRVLKGGNLPPKAIVRFIMPTSAAGWVGYTGIDPATYRMLFLKRSDDHFELANRSVHPLPAVQRAAQSTPQNALGSVLAELSAVLDSTQIPEVEKLDVIYRLGSTNDPTVVDVLRPKLGSSNAAIRTAIVAALLQQNYLPAMAEAQKLLMAPPTSIPSYLLVNLSSAIGRYVKDDKAIPNLSVLLTAPDVQTRRAAALALRNTGSQNAIPALTHALDDSDSEVRYYSVIGLGEITSQPDWRPLMEDFKSNEKKYLDYWREWRVTHPVSKTKMTGV